MILDFVPSNNFQALRFFPIYQKSIRKVFLVRHTALQCQNRPKISLSNTLSAIDSMTNKNELSLSLFPLHFPSRSSAMFFPFFPTTNFDSLEMGCFGSAVGSTSFDFVHSSSGLLSGFPYTKCFFIPHDSFSGLSEVPYRFHIDSFYEFPYVSHFNTFSFTL
jgi:hypothetical protein